MSKDPIASARARAETNPASSDPRLRGRTYAIPFDRVWSTALAAIHGGLARWKVLSSDDEKGVILAEARTAVLRRDVDIHIKIGLDEYGQTRVDIRTALRGAHGDLGATTRLIAAFLEELDRRLGATPSQILDPLRPPTWTS
ncbi:MAG: hypothetical protein AMXMBFR53_34310 [Gemmatimonadota bacterium]